MAYTRRYKRKSRRPRHYGSKKRTSKASEHIPKSMTYQTYNFTRDIETNLDFGRIAAAGAGPFNLYYTNDGGVAGSHSIQLNELPNYGEFLPLFKQYRIVACKIFMYPTANVFTAGTGVNTQNNNIMMRVCPNETGTPIQGNNGADDWNQLQSKKRYIIRPNKQITLYNHLKQNVDVNSGPIVIGYKVGKPGFIDIQNPSVEHWGWNFRFDPLDASNDMSNANQSFPKMKIIQKVYFQMKATK